MKRRLSISALVACTALAACSSSDSILGSGNEATTTTAAPTNGVSTVTEPSADGTAEPDPATSTPPTAAPTPPPTTTTPLDSLPACPVDALDAAGGPVDVLFWHGLNAESDRAIQALTEGYNAAQSRVRVRLEPQGSYDETFDKYIQSSQDSRPDLVMFPEYYVQQTVDSGSVIPVGACMRAASYDTSQFQESALATYEVGGVQWAMPFNLSNVVLYYNRSVFRAAGLDPDRPPLSLDELREYSQAIVDSGAASYGVAIDSAYSGFGGWVVEQWLANAGEFYTDNENGHLAPATEVLYDGPAGVELLTYLQSMVDDGLAAYVGGNSGGQDNYLKLADRSAPAAMTAGSSASLGTIKTAVDNGLIPGITGDEIGVGPLPSPTGTATALVGGASLYVVADHGDATSAAVWDYITFLVSAQSQSDWAARTGYVPVRVDALDLEPLTTTYVDDPRFKVAYDQLIGSSDVPTMRGPILGPQREVRVVTARAVAEILDGGDVQTALTDAATAADALITEYNARN
jgi:sn-glycerol 3-phosphate transport system substrate-binding protein